MIFFEMSTLAFSVFKPPSPIDTAIRELVSARQRGDVFYISLPMFFPSGTAATVKVEPSKGGFRVSDNGFAYRELESISAERSFAKIAGGLAEKDGLEKNRRTVSVEANADELGRAICDVAATSWQIVTRVFSEQADDEQNELEEGLTEKLISLFGEGRVQLNGTMRGKSSSEWGVSAIVDVADRPTVFQAVSNHSGSVYRTNSAFHDLSAIHKPPTLVAVVKDKKALGPRLSLLSQAGRVIEEDQPDDVFLRAVA
jgi:hypothetical protein